MNSHVRAVKVTKGPTKGPTPPSTQGPTSPTSPTSPPQADLPHFTVPPFYSTFTCPNPQIKGRECRPNDPHKSYLCDPNSMLSKADGKCQFIF